MELKGIYFAHLLISSGIFILLWKVVGEGMMKPFFDLLAEREQKTVGDELKAKKTLELSTQVAADIESELLEARVEGVKLREEQLNAARGEVSKVTDQASKEAEATLSAGRGEISSLASKARSDLESEIDGLAKVLVSRVLGKEVAGKTVH